MMLTDESPAAAHLNGEMRRWQFYSNKVRIHLSAVRRIDALIGRAWPWQRRRLNIRREAHWVSVRGWHRRESEMCRYFCSGDALRDAMAKEQR